MTETGYGAPGGWLLTQGIRFPGPLREEGSRVVQSSNLLVRAAPAAVAVGWLACLWAFARLARGDVEGAASAWLPILLSMGVTASIAGAWLHLSAAGRWEIDDATGTGRLSLRGWPFTRHVTVSMRAIERVVMMVADTMSERGYRTRVGLKLADGRGGSWTLVLANYRSLESAQGVVAFLSTWLQAKVEERWGPEAVPEFDVKLPTGVVHAPADPVGEASTTVRADRLVYRTKKNVLVFTAGPGQRAALAFVTAAALTIVVMWAVMSFSLSPRKRPPAAVPLGGVLALVNVVILVCWRYLDLCVLDGGGRYVWLRIGYFGRFRPIGFDDVAAVQMLTAGPVSRGRYDSQQGFELNLVLKTGRRRNLYLTTNPTSLRSNAANIARFLNVPLINQSEGLIPRPIYADGKSGPRSYGSF